MAFDGMPCDSGDERGKVNPCAAAFDAADYMMDRLKTDALFWKREETASGSRWIEPRDDDYAARERWSD